MADLLISIVRSYVMVALGAVVAWLASLGVDVPMDGLDIVVTAVITGVVLTLVRALEEHLPILGRILMLGMPTPSYYRERRVTTPDRRVMRTEDR